MAFSIVSGVVSHLQQSTDVMKSGGQLLNFRINGQPVAFKFKESGISDEDIVTAAGYMKKGTFRALSVRNETTGAVLTEPSLLFLILGVLFLLLGFGFSVLIIGAIIGFPMIIGGVFCIYRAWLTVRANHMLASTPRPAIA